MHGVDPQLLARLLAEHGAALELLARQRCRQPADVVQEALVQLARQKALPDNPVAWLYRAVRNGAISAARSEQRRKKHETAAASESQSWFQASLDEQLDAVTVTRLLADLPIEDREVVIGRLWGHRTFEEIAVMLGSSSSTVHRRYQAALEVLRQRLGEVCSPNKMGGSR